MAAHLAGAAGCAEEKVFDLKLLPPGAGCSGLGVLGAYVVLTWEGDELAGCSHGPCPAGAAQPMECLAGVETPAVETGRALRVKAMIYGNPPTGDPILCGETATPSADLDMGEMTLRLECEASCQQMGCQPNVCANEQRQHCPEFHP